MKILKIASFALLIVSYNLDWGNSEGSTVYNIFFPSGYNAAGDVVRSFSVGNAIIVSVILLGFGYLLIKSSQSKNLSKIGLALTIIAAIFVAILGWINYEFQGFPYSHPRGTDFSPLFPVFVLLIALALAAASFFMEIDKAFTKSNNPKNN